jgi:hypothetical protein
MSGGTKARLPGRPAFAGQAGEGTDCALLRISEFRDIIVSPYMQMLKYYTIMTLEGRCNNIAKQENRGLRQCG